MALFMISFGAGAMDHIPPEEMPSVADAGHAVVQEIVDAGAYVLAGAISDGASRVVAIDGSVTDGVDLREISGVTVVDVATVDDALRWAAKIAVACRCAQEVRAIGPDPQLDEILSRYGR